MTFTSSKYLFLHILGGLLTANFIKDNTAIEVKFGNENSLKLASNSVIDTDAVICRYLARCEPESELYGTSLLEELEVDHWITFSIGPLSCSKKLKNSIQYLNYSLSSSSYLVGCQLTIADFIVWGTLFCK